MDIAKRFAHNPVIRPENITPSLPNLQVVGVLNPGVFHYDGKLFLLLRVAERQVPTHNHIGTPIADRNAPNGIRLQEFSLDDPKLQYVDPRVFYYDGDSYLTTLSHLRLAWSTDAGQSFTIADKPSLLGDGALERYGIEDCRVSCIADTFYLSYTAVSESGVGVALISTRDWRSFHRLGMILPPHNKDCAIFETKFGADYLCLHRPVGAEVGGAYIWTARSRDLTHWGRFSCLARTRPGMWDSARIGAGAPPIRTTAGWLEIYHGADDKHRYCLGALLLDLNTPETVLARSQQPIMEPIEPYEQNGFFGNVVFSNGHTVSGDTISLYYGASDSVVCGASLSIAAILATLQVSA